MTWYCSRCFFFFFIYLFFLLCDWHFSWIWQTEKCWNGKMLSSVIGEIWHQKKNQTNWAISQNANDLVWLFLFISSLFKLCCSPVTEQMPKKMKKESLQLYSIFFCHFLSFFLQIYDLLVYNNLYSGLLPDCASASHNRNYFRDRYI